MKHRWLIVLSIVIIASMLLTACKPTAPAAEAPKKLITGAWSQEPDNIVPYYTSMSYAVWICQLTLVGLAEWDENSKLVPELAQEVPTVENGGVSADGLTITWKLKKDLKWSDGEPLTSKDVKFTWESVIDEANAVSYGREGYTKIGAVETPDDQTVVLKFKELYPPWQTLFTQGPNNAGAILPAHILQGQTGLEKNPFIHHPTIASGPFVITDWVAGDHMELTANDNFYKGRAKLDVINIKFVPDPETALAGLQAGDIDWYPDFAESDIATLDGLQTEGKLKYKAVPTVEFEHYAFFLGQTAGVEGREKTKADKDGFCPFFDYKVRKAIILGINRQAIVDSLLEGKTTVPATLWPNSEWTNTSLKPEDYNPDEAMKLLEEAGYTDTNGDGIREGKCNGQDVTLSVNFFTTNKQIRVDIAVAVQSDLKKIGIEFKPNHEPAGTFFGTYTDGGTMATDKADMFGYTTGYYPDPYPSGGDFSCDITGKDNPGGANYTYQNCDLELEKLFNAVNASADPAARKVAIDAVQKYMYDNALIIPMYARANIYGFTNRLDVGNFGPYSNMNWQAETWDVTE